MNTKTKLAGLFSTVIMTTFGAANGHAMNLADNTKEKQDTLKVLGTNKTFRYDYQTQRRTPVMFLKCVNKYGQIYYVEPETELYEDEEDVFFIQRGDVIILTEKARLVKNLTQEKIKAEFVKNR